MKDPARPDVARLLGDVSWVRALARRLVHGEEGADDVAQDTLAAAIAHPPERGTPLKRWLARVARNFARQHRRRDAARSSRERAVARPEHAVEGADAQAARLDAFKELVRAVERLPEPYRSAIVLRYFEGLAPDAIAKRTGAPVRTVHTRLRRALERLREDLEREHGRAAWLALWIPWTDGADASSIAWRIALQTKTKVGIACIAAALLVAVSAVAWRDPASPVPARTNDVVAAPEGPPELAIAAPAEPELARAPAVTAAEDGAAREASLPTLLAAARAEPTPTPPLAGRVLDAGGAPVAGVDVRFVSVFGGEARDEWRATSAADGSFALPRGDAEGSVEVDSPGWITVLRPITWQRAHVPEHVLVIAPQLEIAGHVSDAAGLPLGAVDVSVRVPHAFRARIDRPLDTSQLLEWRTQTDALGAYTLAAPAIGGATLCAAALGVAEVCRDLPPPPGGTVDLVLGAETKDLVVLRGRVVAEDGSPALDARVALGGASARTDAGGEFALRTSKEDEGQALIAVRDGFLPARVERGDGWPDPLVLRLGGAPLAIRGRVVDGRGDAVLGASVWLADPTPFGKVDLSDVGLAVRIDVDVERLVRGELFETESDAGDEGRFEIGGLSPRAYTLRVLDARSLRTTDVPGVRAGTSDLVVRLPDELLRARIAGRLVSRGGDPVAGVDVALRRVIARPAGPPETLTSRAVQTDAAGRFEFTGVARDVVGLQANGAVLALEGETIDWRAGDDLEHLELVVPLRCHFQVDLGVNALGADAFQLLDGAGSALHVIALHGNVAIRADRQRLDSGRSEVLSVSEAAEVLVLYRGDAEVARATVRLVVGQTNVIGR